MEFERPKSKVYIQADDAGRIFRCDGGYTTPDDLTGWIEIDEGTGDKYNLCQSHYFAGGLDTMDGIPRYRWDGSTSVERTEEELEEDRKGREPVLTPAQQREQAYNTQPIVEWDGQLLTVTEAAQQWAYYSAEGATGKTPELTSLLSQPKLLRIASRHWKRRRSRQRRAGRP